MQLYLYFIFYIMQRKCDPAIQLHFEKSEQISAIIPGQIPVTRVAVIPVPVLVDEAPLVARAIHFSSQRVAWFSLESSSLRVVRRKSWCSRTKFAILFAAVVRSEALFLALAALIKTLKTQNKYFI